MKKIIKEVEVKLDADANGGNSRELANISKEIYLKVRSKRANWRSLKKLFRLSPSDSQNSSGIFRFGKPDRTSVQ